MSERLNYVYGWYDIEQNKIVSIGKHFQTPNVELLMDGYFTGTKLMLRRAEKYGRDRYEKVILKSNILEKNIAEEEQRLIVLWKTGVDFGGCNISRGGEGGALSKETREKISIAARKRYESPEAHIKSSEGRKRYLSNPENLEKHRENVRNQWKNMRPEDRKSRCEKMRKSNLGTKRSKETIEKQRNIMLEKWQDPTYRQKVSEGLKNCVKTPWSESARKNQSEAQKRRFSDPEELKRHSKRMKNHWNKPGFRENQSKKQRSGWTPERRAAHGQKIKAAKLRNAELRN